MRGRTRPSRQRGGVATDRRVVKASPQGTPGSSFSLRLLARLIPLLLIIVAAWTFASRRHNRYTTNGKCTIVSFGGLAIGGTVVTDYCFGDNSTALAVGRWSVSRVLSEELLFPPACVPAGLGSYEVHSRPPKSTGALRFCES